MECIKIITDEYFGLEIKEMKDIRLRLGARGIVINKDNKIAILNKVCKNEYKLIGGGIEEDEDAKEAFKREVLEETGCEIEISNYLGTIEEIKSHDNFKQISYVFVGYVTQDTSITNYTQKEIDEGSRLLWLYLDEALKLIKQCESNLTASKYESIYHTKFIVRRDYEILAYYKSTKENSVNKTSKNII